MPSENRILIDWRAGRKIAARMISGKLQDLLIENRRSLQVGEIWTARIDKPASRDAGGGVFVSIGKERAFLPGKPPGDLGDWIKVEIQRPAEDGKAATATAKLSFAGPRVVHTPDIPGINVSRKLDSVTQAALKSALGGLETHGGFVLRTAAADLAPADLRAEAEACVSEAEAIAREPMQPSRQLRAAPGLEALARRQWPDAIFEGADEETPIDARPLARHGVEEELRQLLRQRVSLERGGAAGAWLSMERTAALIAIDINAGASPKRLPINLAAMAEIPRQLRLRGWGGQIVIDPAGRGDEKMLEAALRKAADAPLRPLGFGPLGLLEARRKRDRAPIETLLCPADLEGP